MSVRQRQIGAALRGGAVLLAAAAGLPAAHAASQTVNGPLRLDAHVDLEFRLTIDKFLFFRIGDGAWPNPGGNPSEVKFDVGVTIPGQVGAPVAGSNTGVGWTGAAPSFTVAATNNVLPVDVRSNAGQVTLKAEVTTALSNGSVNIPMTDIGVTSSDAANLPAPPIPASGTGTSVTVAGGGTGTINQLVTSRTADWTFTLSGGNYTAGTYTGTITFTASAP